jgi:DNA-binding MarR family transcriptional regulator
MQPADEPKQGTTGDGGNGLPLATLLSQVLVAFTIEFDNEFEHRIPHRTTRLIAVAEQRTGPWLTSMVMWSNLMRLVSEDGLTVGELEVLARTAKLSLAGMERWGYIRVEPDPADRRSRPPRRDWLVRPTAKGRRAQEVWRPLFAVIEKRWQERFGKDEVESLREALSVVLTQLNADLPDYLPVLGYGLSAEVFSDESRAPVIRNSGFAEIPNLPALLSKVLLAFTIDFESESDLSLAISANVVRFVDENGVRVRDLPHLAGVSKEAIKMALSFLEKRHYIVLEPGPPPVRAQLVRFTPKGRAAQSAYHRRLSLIEERWQVRFGRGNITKLRQSLEALAGDPTDAESPLFLGLEPYPDGWRATVRKPDTLPHYPMVLHRGGYPDGS